MLKALSSSNITPIFVPLPTATEGGAYKSFVSSNAVYYGIATDSDTALASAVMQKLAKKMSDQNGQLAISDILSIRIASCDEDAEMITDYILPNISFSHDLIAQVGDLSSLQSKIPSAIDAAKAGGIPTSEWFMK